MQKRILSLVLLVLTGCSSQTPPEQAQSLPDGVHFVESVPNAGNDVVIPYSKYVLDNGLTVILHEDDSDPLVHVDVTYHVGSAREQLGKSGFAHFFEHMMFQGSKHVGDQEHFRLITEAGGSMNGTTNRDRTNYFETVPSNQLEKVLWLESDRMGFLLSAVSQHKFEIQRSTVKNERAQRYENSPYGLVHERLGEALFPRTHPYSWQPIGYVEDLDRVDVNDLKAFFLRWYGPNNATLTIGGKLDKAETLAWVQKYFGGIPRGPKVDNPAKQPVTLAADRFLTLEDNIRQPMLMMAWPTSYKGAKDDASLDMLAKVIGGGQNSMLYQSLVKTGKVVDAGAYHDCGELACTLYVYAIGQSGEQGKLNQIYDDVSTVLSSLAQRGVNQKDLDEMKGMAEASAIFGLQSVHGKVAQLAAYQTFYGNPNRLGTELKNLRDVQPSDVEAAYQRYVENKPKVVLSTVPNGRTDMAATKANYQPAERIISKHQHLADNELHLREPQHESFDRSVMPQPSAPVTAKVPELYRLNLANGIEVLGTDYDETPTIELQLVLPAGRRYEPSGKNGLAELTAAMMAEDSLRRSSEELVSRLDTLGSMITFDPGMYDTVVSVTALKKHLPETLAILQERLLEPAFKADDFARIKQQALEGLVYDHQRPSWLASQATREVLYGKTVFGRPAEGTMASIQGITLNDVKAFYQRYYTPNGAQLAVVGDIPPSELKADLAFLSQWQGAPAPTYVTPVLQSQPQAAVWLIDKPDAPQSTVRFVRRGLPYDATGEQFEIQLANFNLAGNFNSRINLNLREDKGYTYGAGGYQVGNKEVGSSVFYAEVRADATLPSIQEMLKELEKYSQDGLTKDELAFMRLAVGQQEALSYETPSDKADLLRQIMTYDLADDFVSQRNTMTATISKQRLNELAGKWFNPADYQIIVVGDAASLSSQLKTLGRPVHQLTPEQ
ncbi:M16 family metallopeptidase [Photobacterium galatheae]|uniref:Peptidase M16 n=1 Tax=Photobacterium galatheae TaxID=1654360 RepID=A0A066RU18_9GAMM|nr:pitrilysin family protein [Photobacterium galatheae]KDM92601.1 peptidase M16 [Photobacterium galatheae]MCM0149480.1 insulinase family protein [Photobacterium galatheae]